eukprot:PITA_07565
MNVPSELHSTSLSCNDVKRKLDVGSASSSNKFVSTQLPEYPQTYNTLHGHGFVDRNPATPTGLHDLLDHPYLMATSCTSSLPAHVQPGNRLTGAVPSAKRNAKTIERQRRREMKTLFSTLRSLLPDENLRGKRSVTDQVEAAVNYISQLQQRIEDLSAQRDNMKAKANSRRNANVSLDGLQLSYNQKICKSPLFRDHFPAVEIKSFGLGIQVSTKTFEHHIVYSDLLQALEETGLEVFSAAVFAISNNRVFHTIHAKVHDLKAFNVDILYEKLWHLIINGHSQDLQDL